MTEQDFTTIKYWMDLAIKAVIGVIISLVGLDYRAIKNNLKELEEAKYKMSSELAVVGTEVHYIKSQIDKIDSKLDRVLR